MNKSPVGTKQKLIDIALELIWKNSYGSVSVDDICKTAGIGKGSFYYFFQTKSDLAIAAMDANFAQVKLMYDEVFSSTYKPLERIKHYANLIYKTQEKVATQYGRVCGCPCVSLGSEMSGQDCGIREKFLEISYQQERYLENALRDMVATGVLSKTTNIKSTAQSLYAYTIGQVSLARIQNNLSPLKRNLKKGLLQLLGISDNAIATTNE